MVQRATQWVCSGSNSLLAFVDATRGFVDGEVRRGETSRGGGALEGWGASLSTQQEPQGRRPASASISEDKHSIWLTPHPQH